jgi:hypothetical protein
MTDRYDDIINLPHPVSRRHPQMPPADRAAQFSPFAALTGYDAEIQETARQTDRRIELDEDEKRTLDDTLRALLDRMPDRPPAQFTYFQPDSKKAGGAYLTATGSIKKYDAFARLILLDDGTKIPADDVVAIKQI